MANVLVNDASLTAIANAIRAKTNNTDTYTPAEMAEAINAIEIKNSNKNVQYYMGAEYIQDTTSYTGTGVEITVTKDGTYTVSWMAWRSTSSGTSGTQLYINGRAYGSAYTTWTHDYGQCNTISGVELSVGDVVEVYARAYSKTKQAYTHAGNLIIEEE